MKTIISIILTGFICLNPLNAQDSIQAKDSNQKIKIYRTWVSLKSDPYKIKGVLYEIKDSSIFISNSMVKKDYSIDRFEVVEIQINNILKIKIRRKNSMLNGIWIGALSGFVVGGVLGLMSDDSDYMSSEGMAIYGGAFFAGIGAGVGGLFGLLKIGIPINGSMDNYNRNKDKLKKYSINKN